MRRRHQVLTLLLLISAAVAAIGVRTQPQPLLQTLSGKRAEKVKSFPVVDFDEPELSSKQLREKRQTKSKRYDKSSGQKIHEPDVPLAIIRSSGWADDLPAIPVRESDVVLIAFVKNATAHLAADKTAVYSEFSSRIVDVLKGDPATVTLGGALLVQRFGGVVRFRNGKTITYEIAGQGMPRVGRQYIFFLKAIEESDDFRIITAYDITDSVIIPLDGAIVDESTRSYPFDEYAGYDTSKFLNRLRQVLTKAG